MAIMKCKMCGGDLNVVEGVTVTECDYCGTKQTVPSADNEKKTALFTRANKLRMSCDFDKAAGVYESIVTEFSDEAEAYWGLVLCKYGIEYVDDPLTGKKIPTCHRSSFESVMDDENFELVMENADALSISVYREEAKQIEELRKGIIEVSSKEEPYDIFICYKETAENGDRTLDSLIAQDVYNELTAKGYRVFFSRITLETTLGKEYEPYIFAALNSAKIMLAFGTCYEHYNAVWVKNEWSRFLQLIAAGEKKTLIPCYKGIDAYDMPKEFTKLQAQDMGKVGAIQDLVRGIEKILPKNTQPERVIVQNAAPQSATTETLLKRAFMYLEDGDWANASIYCEKVLDIDPENAQAYFAKLLGELKIKNKNGLLLCETQFEGSPNYQKAVRFGDGNLAAFLKGAATQVETNHKRRLYDEAVKKMNSAQSYAQLQSVVRDFQAIGSFEDAEELLNECIKRASTASKEEKYNHACELLQENKVETIGEASDIFFSIAGYRDAEQKVYECRQALQKIKDDYDKYWEDRFGVAFDQIKAKHFADAASTLKQLQEERPRDARVYIGKLLINYQVRDEKELMKQTPQDEGGIEKNKYYKEIMACGDEKTVAHYKDVARAMKHSKTKTRLINLATGIIYMILSVIGMLIAEKKSSGFISTVLILSAAVVIYAILSAILSRITGNKYSFFDWIMSIFFVSIITDIAGAIFVDVNRVILATLFNKVVQGVVGLVVVAITLSYENFEDNHNKNA